MERDYHNNEDAGDLTQTNAAEASEGDWYRCVFCDTEYPSSQVIFSKVRQGYICEDCLYGGDSGLEPDAR